MATLAYDRVSPENMLMTKKTLSGVCARASILLACCFNLHSLSLEAQYLSGNHVFFSEAGY